MKFPADVSPVNFEGSNSNFLLLIPWNSFLFFLGRDGGGVSNMFSFHLKVDPLMDM